MSSQAPRQSPLDQAKAESNDLIQKVHDDLDRLLTAPVNELEKGIDSLKNSFKASQASVIANVETAFASSDKRIGDLEESLQAAQVREDTLTDTLSTQRQEAQAKHNQVTVELASQKLNYGLATTELRLARGKLEEANRRAGDLQTELEAVKQQVVGLQTELELAKRQPVDLQERVQAVEQQNAGLKADLQAATYRASTAEDEFKAFRSRFKQINEDMTALASSSEQQPAMARPVSSPAPSPTRKDSLEESHSEPQTQGHHVQASDIEPHTRDTSSDEEPKSSRCWRILNEVMDEKHRQYSRHFLMPVDPTAPSIHAHDDASTEPMSLRTIKEKLEKGAYISDNSFKEDFDLMIADRKRLNPDGSLARTAAEQLTRIFEQAWSPHRISGHESVDNATSTEETSNKKRKAETETVVLSECGRAPKRRSLTPPREDIKHSHRVSPGDGESVTSFSSSHKSGDTSNGPRNDDTHSKIGQVTISTRLPIQANVQVVPRLVSVIKSPNTLNGPWDSLLPVNYWITAHALPSRVEQRLAEVAADLSKDMFVFRVLPASDADKPEFNRVLKYFQDIGRCATVSHAGVDNVEDIYLMPVSKDASYPQSLATLETKALPPAKTEDVLFMITIFGLEGDKHTEVRQAWDGLIKSVHHPHLEGLAAAVDHLLHHQLPTFVPTSRLLSRAKRHMPQHNKLRQSEEILDPKLLGIANHVLRLSDSKADSTLSLKVAGIKPPQSIFILGRLVTGPTRPSHGLLVIDILHEDRPLWWLFFKVNSFPTSIRKLTMLRSKCPASLSEWENTFTPGFHKLQSDQWLKGEGLKMERYRLPQ